MTNVFFLHQIKHNATKGMWDKGIVIKDNPEKDNLEEAKQGYHSYLGAYAYNHDPDTDYVSCQVTNLSGFAILDETWEKRVQPPEPEPEPEGEDE